MCSLVTVMIVACRYGFWPECGAVERSDQVRDSVNKTEQFNWRVSIWLITTVFQRRSDERETAQLSLSDVIE